MNNAYAAGFVDGEGTISIVKAGVTKNRRTPEYVLKVTVVNTYLPILDEFQSAYGGSISERKGINKPVFAWNVSGVRAAECLRTLQPLLQEKRNRAWLGLEFWAQRSRCKPGVITPDKELALREGYYRAMRFLHE